MGGSSSKPTVLDCMRKNFKNGVGGGFGVKTTLRKPCDLCELLWPAFAVGWPPEGARPAHGPSSAPGRHWASGTSRQFPHRDSSFLTAQILPPWARFCPNGQEQSSVSVARSLRKKERWGESPIFQGDAVEDPLMPPPHIPLTPQAPAQPAPDPLPGSPPPSLAPHHLTSKTPLASAWQISLRETEGPQQVTEDDSVHTTDPLNWEHHNSAYSDRSWAMTDLLKTLGCYHDAFLHGLQAGVKKPTNMSNITAMIQKVDETPPDFYERLYMRRKLQTLDGFAGMNATQLLEVANEVFVN
ncbi:hypothetical protein FD754_024443 [Muntiacus muntjak]|uniref:Core shell protein Gag P30 domain-containing protein n=1 Tax=Muntiacus muntjak TaxID=9888 RepID=A0A5N3UPQ6_MUNMU|nr:hypothetical protein FD754_024443 [Muntiacus muntjak]